MFSSPLNSLDILRTLARGHKGPEAAGMARVFVLMLQQSRFGWLSGEGQGDISPGAQMNAGVHQSILNHLASRVSAAGSQPVMKAVKNIQAYQAVGPELKPKPERPAASVPRSIPLLAKQAAEKHGVPSKLFRRLIWVESGFNPAAVSPRGAMGLGQLMPETARELGLAVEPGQGEPTVWDPESNLDASARYLKWLHGTFVNKGIDEKEAWRFSAAAYNAGIGNISKAMARAGEVEGLEWDRVARQLPRVTGRASGETLTYLERLRL